MPFLPTLVATTVVPFLLKLLGALGLWVVGGWLIRLGVRLMRQAMGHSRLDPTMAGYLVNFIAVILRVILVVAILGFFGIPTASFAALLAGAGVAIGAAWSGMLGNFAAGVFLQMFRPFSVGDVICAAGVTGTVEEIGMFMSSILAADHVRNIVPNSRLFGDTIQNFSSHTYRRVDLTRPWGRCGWGRGLDPRGAAGNRASSCRPNPRIGGARDQCMGPEIGGEALRAEWPFCSSPS